MASRPHPSQVPPEAWWSEKDTEWVLGARDPQGRFQGPVRYWRPDGTLCCVCEHADGQPHGRATRYHESGEISQTCTYDRGQLHGVRTFFATDTPTTEKLHVPGMSLKVRRASFTYEHGALMGMRYFDAQDNLISQKGEPVPPRPQGVDPEATFSNGLWIRGRWTEEGRRNGRLRYFNRDGVLIEETEWRDDQGEGLHRAYDAATGGLREEVTYHAGLREGHARGYRINGTLAREASFSQGQYHGLLQDFDASGTRVVREVRFLHGERQPPSLASPPPPPPVPVPHYDWRERIQEARDSGHLDLSYAGLEQVPEEVRALRELRWLNLSHNRLRSLPSWLLELDSLRQLILADNRLPLPRTGRAVMAWVRKSRGLPEVDRRVRFCLFLGDLPQARAEGDVEALVRALDDSDAAVRAYAELATSGQRQSPRPSDPASLARLYATAETHPDATERRRARQQLRREAPLELWAFLQGFQTGLQHQSEDDLTRRLRILGGTGLLDLQTLAETIFQHRRKGVPILLESGGPRVRALLASLISQRTLSLEMMGLQRVPPELGSFGDLAILKLGYNRLTTLPEELGDLFSLVELWVELNPLTELPESLSRLVQLRRLVLNYAELRSFPEAITALGRLTHLTLGGCGLSAVPESIGRLGWLQDLALSHNRLTTLPESLAELRQLTYLHLAGNPLGTVPPVIFELSALKTLWLEGCELHTLSPEIARLTQLETLCIWYNALESLPVDALASLPRLRDLRIRNNRLPPEQEAQLRAALPRCTIY